MAATRKSQLQAGYTLLELLVVLSILAIVAALSVPLIRPPGEAQLVQQTARDMASILNATRSEAERTGEDQVFVFDLAAREFWSDARTGKTRLGGAFPATMTSALTHETVKLRGTVIFHPDGSSSGASISLGSDANRQIVEVDWLTGAIDVSTEPR